MKGTNLRLILLSSYLGLIACGEAYAQENAATDFIKEHVTTTVDTSDIQADPIYPKVDKIAEYPKGKEALREFLKKNLCYPYVGEEVCIQGRVMVKFVVCADGTITHPEVVRSVDPLMDAEALRVVRLMGKWIPAEINGKAVNSYFVLPIRFKF